MAEKQKLFDEGFAHLAHKAGSIDVLLEEFFGFLNRRTDFYVQFDEKDQAIKKYNMGFPKGEAEKKLLKAFHKYPLEDFEAVQRKMDRSTSTPPPAPSSSAATNNKTSSSPSTSTSISKSSSTSSSPSKPSTTTSSPVLPQPRVQENGLQIPIGNGGIGENYYWTQTLHDLTIYLTLPMTEIKGKDVDCQIKASSIQITLKHLTNNQPTVLLIGCFDGMVNTHESIWTINRDKEQDFPQLVVQLEKTKEIWWKSVLQGHPEIDTTKVDSTRNITDYDEITQAAIRKVMFDHQQKMKGLPSSEELVLQETLAKASILPNSPL